MDGCTPPCHRPCGLGSAPCWVGLDAPYHMSRRASVASRATLTADLLNHFFSLQVEVSFDHQGCWINTSAMPSWRSGARRHGSYHESRRASERSLSGPKTQLRSE